MYNEEEIKDSLEFCRDIEVYYEGKNEKNAYQSYLKQRAVWGKSSIGARTASNSGAAADGVIAEQNLREQGTEKTGLFNRICRGLGSFLLLVFLAYGISCFVTNYCFWHTQVDGASMEPALKDGDKLVIDKLSYHFREPERFDIVVFPQKIDVYYVKRIIGLPGETVQIQDGRIYIDGIALAENYGKEPMRAEYDMELPVTLGENQYFVLGDNRNFSIDSRDASVGLISKNYIIGKVWKIKSE